MFLDTQNTFFYQDLAFLLMCPSFWVMFKTELSVLGHSFDQEDIKLSKSQCRVHIYLHIKWNQGGDGELVSNSKVEWTEKKAGRVF